MEILKREEEIGKVGKVTGITKGDASGIIDVDSKVNGKQGNIVSTGVVWGYTRLMFSQEAPPSVQRSMGT